ncbi:two-component system sensor histidine kinase NtrB [Neobacillus niacini]|uniref:two-component system sensor histidine kinase NtrB n=1 Tax=Neobacillus niacini TaxID=86668 RepID=UPI003983BB23
MKINGKRIDFHQLVENSLNSVWLVGKDRRILYCNKAGQQLLNHPSIDDILNKNINLFLPPDIHDFCNQGIMDVIENQKVFERMEIKIIKNHGEIADVELTAIPCYFEDTVLVQVNIQDITEKRITEKRLKEREKLISLGQLAAGIVHEVKNPLTSVKGFLQLLKESQDHPYLVTMESELDKAFETLQNLLQVSKPDLQSETPILIDLCKELNSILLLFQERLYSIEVTMDLRDSNVRFYGKKNLLLKSFFNLIKNAIEAITYSGKLKIEHYYHSGWIHIMVSDNGHGIPEDKLMLLGTPFYSSKPDGTGLGLTQVYTTIHEHGGTISVQSEIGKGTTFHIQLPVDENR